jgi:hypothetical protein
VTVPIVPHRQNRLIYGVFGGTAPLAGHRPLIVPIVRHGWGTVGGRSRGRSDAHPPSPDFSAYLCGFHHAPQHGGRWGRSIVPLCAEEL